MTQDFCIILEYQFMLCKNLLWQYMPCFKLKIWLTCISVGAGMVRTVLFYGAKKAPVLGLKRERVKNKVGEPESLSS